MNGSFVMRSRPRRRMIDDAGQPTRDAVTLYTESDCWLLAFELGKRLNAPLVALAREDDPEDWVHVMVDLGRERLLDVLGMATRDESLVTWEKRMEARLVIRELGRFASLQSMLGNLDDCRLDMMLTQHDEDNVAEVAHALAERDWT